MILYSKIAFLAKTVIALTLISVLCFSSNYASAKSSHNLKFGPPNVGQGGSNPLGIPPGPADVEYTYVNDNDFEYNFSIVPGFLFGYRASKGGIYTSVGGGLVIGGNGIGTGVYFSSGYAEEFRPNFSYNIEFKQTFGFSGQTKRLIAPGALRIGIMMSY